MINNKFNEEQQHAIMLLARKELDGFTDEEIALQVGVCRKTLHNWRSKPEFQSAVNREALEQLTAFAPVILKNMNDMLLSKDLRTRATATQLWLKEQEKMEEAKKEANSNKKEMTVEEILRELGV